MAALTTRLFRIRQNGIKYQQFVDEMTISSGVGREALCLTFQHKTKIELTETYCTATNAAKLMYNSSVNIFNFHIQVLL